MAGARCSTSVGGGFYYQVNRVVRIPVVVSGNGSPGWLNTLASTPIRTFTPSGIRADLFRPVLELLIHGPRARSRLSDKCGKPVKATLLACSSHWRSKVDALKK